MAKALAYDRANQQAVVVDTINNAVANLGAVFASAETTNLFPGRSKNLIAVYGGDPHFLYLDNVGDIRLSKWDGSTWANVAGFTAISTASGALTPLALLVEQNYLVAVAYLSNSTGADGTIVRRSADGVTWDAPQTLLAAVQPTPSVGGHAISWRNAVFFATGAGIGYYRPLTNTLAPIFDPGDDAGLNGSDMEVGCFASWNGDLFFAKHGTVPVLYRMDPAWDPTSPVVPPAWTNVSATGIVTAGVVTVTADSGQLLLFVNLLDELCMLYSGQLGTKLLKMSSSEYPQFTTPEFQDITSTYLPEGIIVRTDVGFSLFVDDRRRASERQSFLLRDAGDVVLMTWDSSTQFDVRTTFSSTDLMLPDDRFGALRIYTALQPTCAIDSTSAPWPGRVVLNYTVRDSLSRKVDIFGEYSVDGDEWLPMSQGDGDSGDEQLSTTPAGLSYVFYWDAFRDLDGVVNFVYQRVVARLSGV